MQQYDSAGNLVRENGFDNEGREDNVVEYKYDQNNKLIEKINFDNGCWNYRVCKVAGNVQFTQFRKIEYY